MHPDSPLPSQQAASRQTGEDPRVLRSDEILQGNREVTILHNDDRYRLLVTRSGKLILQK
jgi:hemin uptake protein HemP